VSTDLAAAVAGCTTPFSVLPVPVSSAPGEAAEMRRLAEAIAEWRLRGTLRCEHFLRLTADGPASPMIAEFVMRLGTDLARLLGVEAAGIASRPPGNRQNDMAAWRGAGLRVGVTSLTSSEERDAARAGGIGLALFPATRASVEAALGDGFQVVATWQAIQPERLDRRVPDGSALALASAGSPLSLLQTPFVLHDQEGWDLAAAMATVSSVPARIAGLADRGAVAVGLRADFVRVRCEGSLAVPVATWRAGQRIS
jgi:alpha-D-ribose 1-methylphosphonate 5-triphosphate diphosphatase PhnM